MCFNEFSYVIFELEKNKDKWFRVWLLIWEFFGIGIVVSFGWFGMWLIVCVW